jgi:hypothetical protein
MEASAKEDGDGNSYFEGSGTKIVQEAGLSNPYYSSVFKALRNMDCIRMGRRGGGGQGSIWFLLQAPTEELWSSHVPEVPAAKANKISLEEIHQAQRALMQSQAKLESRVAILEAKSA